MVFLLWFLYFFTQHRQKKYGRFLLISLCFLLTCVSDYMNFFNYQSVLFFLEWTFFSVTCVMSTALLLSKYRDFRGLFTGLLTTCFILPGKVFSLVAYSFTNDIISSIIVQLIINLIIRTTISKTMRSNIFHEQDENRLGWKSLCLLPLFFYASITMLTFWPLNILTTRTAIPGVISLVVLMVMVYLTVVHSVAVSNKAAKDEHLQFLVSYSDRLRKEMSKIQTMYHDMEEMQAKVKNTSDEIIKNIEAGSYSKIRTLMEELSADSEDKKINTKLCKNIPVNSVLIEFENFAKENNIIFSYDLNIPEELGGIDFDYSQILLAFLKKSSEFAMESTKRTVHLAMYYAGNSQVFEVSATLPLLMEPDYYTNNFRNLLNQADVSMFIKKYSAGCNFSTHNNWIISELMVQI